MKIKLTDFNAIIYYYINIYEKIIKELKKIYIHVYIWEWVIKERVI